MRLLTGIRSFLVFNLRLVFTFLTQVSCAVPPEEIKCPDSEERRVSSRESFGCCFPGAGQMSSKRCERARFRQRVLTCSPRHALVNVSELCCCGTTKPRGSTHCRNVLLILSAGSRVHGIRSYCPLSPCQISTTHKLQINVRHVTTSEVTGQRSHHHLNC